MGSSVFGESETAGDVLLNLGHAYVPFRPVIGEGDVGVSCQAQDLGLVAGEGIMQILGVYLCDAAALTAGSGRRLWKFPPCFGEDSSVALSHALVVSFGHFLVLALAHLVGGLLQQRFHLSGQDMVVGVDDELEITRQMRT